MKVVDSPPGMTSPSSPTSCSGFRTSTVRAPRRCSIWACSRKFPCTASTPIVNGSILKSYRGAPGSPPAEAADDGTEDHVVGELRREREPPDRRRPAADDAEVERGDREPAGCAPEDGIATRKRAFEHRSPEPRQRKVHRHGGGELHGGGRVLTDEQCPRRPRCGERVAPGGNGMRSRRHPGEDGGNRPRPH